MTLKSLEVTSGGGWSFARCAACTKAGKYPGVLRTDADLSLCAVCSRKLDPRVVETLLDQRRKEGSLPRQPREVSDSEFLDLCAQMSAKLKQCIGNPAPSIGPAFAKGLMSGDPIDALMPPPACYACHHHFRALGPDGKCEECRAEERKGSASTVHFTGSAAPISASGGSGGTSTVSRKPAAGKRPVSASKPDGGKVPIPGVSMVVTDPDGTKRVVPDPDGDGRAELEARAKLAAAELDRLDRDAPGVHALDLPHGLAGMAWHSDWVRYRRAYVLGDDAALDRMRSYVTTANPPTAYDAAKLAPKPPVARKHAVSFTPEGIEIRVPDVSGLRPDQRIGLLFMLFLAWAAIVTVVLGIIF